MYYQLINQKKNVRPPKFEILFQENKEFEPIKSWPTRKFWHEKSKLPQAFEAFLMFAAKCHENDKLKLQKLCKQHLCYNRKNNEKGEYLLT